MRKCVGRVSVLSPSAHKQSCWRYLRPLRCALLSYPLLPRGWTESSEQQGGAGRSRGSEVPRFFEPYIGSTLASKYTFELFGDLFFSISFLDSDWTVYCTFWTDNGPY